MPGSENLYRCSENYVNTAMRANGHQVAVSLLSKNSPHVGVNDWGWLFIYFGLRLDFIFSTWQRWLCACVLKLRLLTLNETKTTSMWAASTFYGRCCSCVTTQRQRPAESDSSTQLQWKELQHRQNSAPVCFIMVWLSRTVRVKWFYQAFLNPRLFLPLSHTSSFPFFSERSYREPCCGTGTL